MRRLIVILMLTLLPFQFVWAAAASYCQHEQGTGTTHFGHHLHKHHGKVLKTSAESSSAKKLNAADDDLDCACCHLACLSPVSQAVPTVVAGPAQTTVSSASCELPLSLPSAIERPNWNFSA